MKYEDGMKYSDFHGLEEITVNDKVYVNKEELMHLITGEQNRYRAGTESGYLNLKKKQVISVDLALSHLKVLLNKRYYEKLNQDVHKYVIIFANEGKFCYLRGYCDHVPGRDGKKTPVFSELLGDAIRYDSAEEARLTVSEIQSEFGVENLLPANAMWPRQKATLRMLHCILGWPEDRDPEDVIREEVAAAREHDK